MGKITENPLSISAIELWEAVDPVKRRWVAEFFEKILLNLFEKKLIDNSNLQAFIFDSILLHYLLNNPKSPNSYFFESTFFPLIVQSGVINDFFSYCEEATEKISELLEKLRSLFSIGPLDIDVKIPNLNRSHFRAIVEMLSNTSEHLDEGQSFLFYGENLTNNLPIIHFSDLNHRNDLREINIKKIGAVKIYFLENVDQRKRENDPLNVVVIEIGYVNAESPRFDNFMQFASIHLSNIPKDDDRLRKKPNSSLVDILGQIVVNDSHVSIQLPQNYERIMYEDFELILDESDPVRSIMSAISTVRKISGISYNFGAQLLTHCPNDELLRNPFTKIHQQIATFLEKKRDTVKLTRDYDKQRFSGDMAIIAMSLGVRDFFIFLTDSGLINFLSENLKNMITSYDQSMSGLSGFYWTRTHITIRNNEPSNISMSFSPELSALKLDPRWNGIKSILEYLFESDLITEKQLDHPLQTFIELFCEPFFEK